MEFRTLKYFLTVAREENITRAAALLHLTQPTLSRQLMQLEEELGINIKTLNRTVKKLKDTGMIGIVKGKLTFNKDQYTKAIAELAVLRKGANHW